MTHSNLIRWIEDAEARKFCETMMAERGVGAAKTPYLRLGEVVAGISSWFRRGISSVVISRRPVAGMRQ